MAGEWIKMRTNLWDDPRVSRLCDLTGAGEAAIVGGLYWLWAMADEHTEDGILPGLTTRAIDRKTGINGLGAALVSISWLEEHPEGVTIVGFEEHNGTSAKRRCVDAQTKANKRKSSTDDPSDVLNVSGQDADNLRTDSGQKTPTCGAREEKRREERKDIDSDVGFASFWSVFPNKKAKQDAFKAWSKLKPCDALQASILKAIEIQRQGEDWRKEGGRFIPHPATWINGRRWEDSTSQDQSTNPFAGVL